MSNDRTSRIFESSAGQELGIAGFTFEALYQPDRLRELTARFFEWLHEIDPTLAEAFETYRLAGGKGLAAPLESELLILMAARLSAFLGVLFRVEAEQSSLFEALESELRLFAFKRDFVARRAFKKGAAGRPAASEYPALDKKVRLLFTLGFARGQETRDEERLVAESVNTLLALEKLFSAQAQPGAGNDVPTLKEKWGALRLGLSSTAEGQATFAWASSAVGSDAEELGRVRELLTLAERWLYARSLVPEEAAKLRSLPTVQLPAPVHFESLVEHRRPEAPLPEAMCGLVDRQRRRDGFKLTDRRFDRRRVMGEVDYCVYCHEREKDSCAKGFLLPNPTPQTGSFKKNPLGIPLSGCPLDERISEAQLLKARGDSVASLAMIMLDNPMVPGTGHRICNDCMKACIFQKQEPVNIPQIETSVLTDVLALPWGFEIFGLLTRWNPLNVRRPHALPYAGKNVLVVGLGPAGYTLAHYLLNEGFGVVGVDGLKIEPLPDELTGRGGRPLVPIRDFSKLAHELDERILAGFGGVSEYGITVRWDKNFLTLIHLTLARRQGFRMYGGVRFGGTLTVEDAWKLGFDHVALATGAGKPTVIPLKNNLLRGIRKASDFLMALQLTGAFKADALANLQVQLPAVVIGGGLTAIDTATELSAYYPLLVTKVLRRHEELVRTLGEEKVWSRFDAEERGIYERYLEHGRAVRAERERAKLAGEEPAFARLVQAWGGVRICYRRSLTESPAYRLSHEEIVKSFEEGITFIERMGPLEAVADEHGAVAAVRFERMAVKDGKLKGTGEVVEFPARTVCVAAGTSPNTTYEREHPGHFRLDEQRQFFQGFDAIPDGAGFRLEPVPATEDLASRVGFFTSYEKGGRFVTFYGDNHPTYAGNVVKAMASARDGYPHVLKLFEKELKAIDWNDEEAQASRDRKLAGLFTLLDDKLTARVVSVQRLTPTILEVVVRAPFAAEHFQPGQFYRLQTFETRAPTVLGTRLTTEGVALTGAWVDKHKGLLSVIILEMGVSSRLCATLEPGEPIVMMGPTGAPTEIPRQENVLLAGGGLGNAVLFSIAQALKAAGCRVIYFAGYRQKADLFKQEEIEAGTDQIVWSVDGGDTIVPRRPQDTTFRGNVVQAMLAFAEGKLPVSPVVALSAVDRVIAIGSDRMMRAVKEARHGVLKPFLKEGHEALGSINSPMQCMMKEICAQCLQKHVDPRTGKESVVFSCFNQDQKLDHVDFANLNARLKANSVLEKQSNAWLDHLLAQAPAIKRI